MSTSGIERRIVTVVLAAGQSRRFGGSSKQLVEIDGEAMVGRTVRVVGGLAPAVLVAGHDAERVMQAARAPFAVVNERYEHGIGTSIAAAVRALGGSADALLLCLADQPWVSADHYRALVAAWEGVSGRIVASNYRDTLGVPALFDRAAFRALAALEGDRGAKGVIAAWQGEVLTVPLTDYRDVDTPDDVR